MTACNESDNNAVDLLMMLCDALQCVSILCIIARVTIWEQQVSYILLYPCYTSFGLADLCKRMLFKLQTISFLLHLYGSERNIVPSLILLPLSVTSNWKTELKR